MLCQHAEGQSSVRIESVKYQGAECDVVQITANVDPGTVSTFSFTWFVNDGSGNVSHVCSPKVIINFNVNLWLKTLVASGVGFIKIF